MKFNKWLLMAAAGVFFIASCEKEDPDNVNKVDITGKQSRGYDDSTLGFLCVFADNE